MTAAVWTGPRMIEVQQVPMPVVPSGWAKIRVAYNGICGTDLSIFQGTHPRARSPLVMGHEMSGWVEEAGEGGPQEGALVVVEPLISCGNCRACRDGHGHVCRRLGLYGIDAPGGLAEYVALPPAVLHEVPVDVDPQVAALTEPLAVAVHAVRLSGMERGDTVLVEGAGPIGVLTALVARHEGAGRVVVAEAIPWRRDVAREYGFTVSSGADVTSVVAGVTEGEGADTTFDTAGHPAVAAGLSTVTRVLGRIVVVGVYKTPPPFDLQGICFREQSVLGVRVYAPADVMRAIELIASGALGLDSFPISSFTLREVSAAFDAASAGEDCLKVMVSALPEEGIR